MIKLRVPLTKKKNKCVVRKMPGAGVRRPRLQSHCHWHTVGPWLVPSPLWTPVPSTVDPWMEAAGGEREKAIGLNGLSGLLPIPWLRNSLLSQRRVISQFEKMNFLRSWHGFTLPVLSHHFLSPPCESLMNPPRCPFLLSFCVL